MLFLPGASRANALRALPPSSRNRTPSSRAQAMPSQLTTCKSRQRSPKTWSSRTATRMAPHASRPLLALRPARLSRIISVVELKTLLSVSLRLRQSQLAASPSTALASTVALPASRCQAPPLSLSSQVTPTQSTRTPFPTISQCPPLP